MPPLRRGDRDDLVALLDDRLRTLGAPLRGYETRALAMGALTSTSLTLGPQLLLPVVFGKAVFLGDDEDEVRATVGLVMLLWNGLNDERRDGGPRFTAMTMSSPATREQLREISMRRSAEITWYLRGIDAGGDDETSFGERGKRAFEGIDQGAQALGRWMKRLAGEEPLQPNELSEAAQRIDEITMAIERLIGELMSLGDAARVEALRDRSATPG